MTADPALVPELLVSDLAVSLEFWRDACGFTVQYSRPEEGFAYVALGAAHLMLEHAGIGRNWVTGALERPFGRGINFQITVTDAGQLAHSLTAAGIDLFLQPETKWYRVGGDGADAVEAGVEQFLVTDPDGYLVRFQSSVGRRVVAT